MAPTTGGTSEGGSGRGQGGVAGRGGAREQHFKSDKLSGRKGMLHVILIVPHDFVV